MPLRRRVALTTTALMAVVIAALAWFVVVRFETNLNYSVEKGLRSRGQSALDAFDVGRPASLREGELIEPDESFVQVLAQDREVIETSRGIKHVPLLTAADLLGLDGEGLFRHTVLEDGDDTPETPALLLAIEPDGDDGPVIVVGASIEDELEASRTLRWNLAIGGSIAVLLSALVAWWTTRAALAPVERMRAEATAISADDDRTLDVPATRDEIARLATTLNEMIERMRDSLKRERRFVDDASHELRTPLSVLRAELEVALRRSRTVEELEASLHSAFDETERLQALAEDLLFLARTDHGRLPLRRASVDVSETIDRTAERHRPAAEGHGVTVRGVAPAGSSVDADEARLRQALDNLVANAIRHTPAGGTVTIAAEQTDGWVAISVQDSGPGFDPAFIPRAFEAFARSDAGRTRDDGGTGLGLAIVRAIAEAHGGSATASNTDSGGARVVLTLPA